MEDLFLFLDAVKESQAAYQRIDLNKVLFDAVVLYNKENGTSYDVNEAILAWTEYRLSGVSYD